MRSREHLMVRSAGPADAEVMARIAGDSPGAADWPPKSWAQIEASSFVGWVCELDREVTGFLIGRIAADEAEILNLAVSPKHRLRGCATALVEEALSAFRMPGATQVLLEVRESNVGAIQFYKRMGFWQSGRRENYYRSPVEAALCLKLKFTGAPGP